MKLSSHSSTIQFSFDLDFVFSSCSLMNLGAISLSKCFDPDLKKKKKKKMLMEERKSSSVSDVGAWGMNIISSVGIIMANKQLMSQTGFAFSFGLYLSSLLSFKFRYQNSFLRIHLNSELILC